MKLKLISTIYKDNQKKTYEQSKEFTDDTGIEMNVVNLYPQMEYQTIEGFGGAITEASGHTFSLMSEDKQKSILEAYFGRDGNRYNLIRTHMDSCDFSLSQYSAWNDPEDVKFRTFNLERDEKYIIPLLKKAEQTSGKKFPVMLSPWSPPAFMKTNEERIKGGSLKPEFQQLWAEYICHYIGEYRRREIDVKFITIQNEPNAVQTWDSCTYTAEQEKVFLRDYLYPALVKSGLENVEVHIWDHNKERMFERACTVFDEVTNKMVQGVAFHWYSGDHFDSIKLVHEKFPDKKLIFTEGWVEYSRFSNAGELENAQMYAHDIIGNLNAGMNAFIDWNLILNKEGGPNHVGNYCDAPIMCDTANDIVQEKLSLSYIGHFSRYIEPGAKRIASTVYTDKLEVVSLKNPDDSLVLILLNRTRENLPVNLRLNGLVTSFEMPATTIVTAII